MKERDGNEKLNKICLENYKKDLTNKKGYGKMIMTDKKRKVKDSKTTVKVRASIEMNVEILGNEIKNQSFSYDDFEYEVLEIKNESLIEEKVNYTDKEI